MSQENLTVRITINKDVPEPPVCVAPSPSRWHKKRVFWLIPALLLLAYGVAAPFIHKTRPEEIPLPQTLNEIAPLPETPLNPLIIEPGSPQKSPSLPAMTIAAQPAPSKQAHATHRQNIPSTTVTNTPSPRIKRMVISLHIRHHEPKQVLSTTISLNDLPDKSLYLFTEVSGTPGQMIHHRWRYKNKIVMDIPLTLGAKRWRCFTRKYFDAKHLGEWRVEITDDHGKLLGQQSITIKS